LTTRCDRADSADGLSWGNNRATVAVRKDRRQVEVLHDAGRQLRTFNPEKTGADHA
jgi:hypothetical protein